MSDDIRERIERSVPYAVTRPDRINAKRYYDPEFYAKERELLWPRVWQMACRLEEIPKRGDYSVYDIFDQSVIVVRINETTVKAFHNHCRHRGVRLLQDRGSLPNGIVCPFHGWQYAIDGRIQFVYEPGLFDRSNLDKTDLHLKECRLETWGGCAFINFDDNAPALRESLEPFATMHDTWRVESLRTEWWLSVKLPCNWKLAMEAFMEGYHVMATHPQMLPAGATPGAGATYRQVPDEFVTMMRYYTMPSKESSAEFDPREFIRTNIDYMRIISDGMAGMAHAKDVATAESLIDTPLPTDAAAAAAEWRKKLNAAVMAEHKKQQMDIADLDELDAKQHGTVVNYCFPHYFLLPMWGSASSYRIRPTGPEECLFEIWSLTRFPPGEQPPPIKTPTPMALDDPRWPPIPKQDYSNLPRQQRGLHSRGFDYMRLSNKVEGLISNYQRLIDGYLAGLSNEQLLPAVQQVSGTIDVPIKDLGF
jgi:Rieske 2Fe-2S family protein